MSGRLPDRGHITLKPGGSTMLRVVIVGITSGIFLWILEAIINVNPYAQNLYKVFKPILKTTLNLPLNLLIYLVYGFGLVSIYLILYNSLPGGIGIVKGMSFALFIWFFRGFMSITAQWLTFNVPTKALVYAAITGLCETLLLGIYYGLTLKHL
jgi:hypothetical protein